MDERKKGLIVLIGGAVAAGIFLGVTRSGPDKKGPTGGSATPSASARPDPKISLPRAADKSEIETAIRTLESGVRAPAGDPKNPWAVAHGLVAFGKDFQTTDGRGAIDAIASYAEPVEQAGKKLYAFPEKKDGKPLEPHRFLFVKTFLEMGLPLDRKLATSTGESVAFSRLLEDLRRLATMPKTDADFHHIAWLLSALAEQEKLTPRAATADGRRANSTPALPTVAGSSVDLRTLGSAALDRLEADQRVVSDYTGPPDRAFDDGSPLNTAKRDKTGIYGHSCGGLHLIQAVSAFAAASGDDAIKARVRKQLGVLLYRYDLERPAYAGLLARHPEQGLLIRVQQLKFHGHLVETLTFARSLGLTEPPSEGGQRIDRVIKEAAHDVAEVTADLDRGGVYLRLAEIRKDREQTYLDLVGDACHAIRGLRRALELY